MADTRAELKALVEEILNQCTIAGSKNTGYAADKTQKREKLIVAANKAGRAAATYYTVVMDKGQRIPSL